MNPGNTTQFPHSGIQTLTSSIFDQYGKRVESQFWSFNIVSAGNPSYDISEFDPAPAPALFTGSPLAINTTPFNITAVVENPSNEQYLNKWFFNGEEDPSLRTNESSATKTYLVDPATLGLGDYTVVNQITKPAPNDSVIMDSATWNFVVRNILDPTFSTFTGQDPAPAPFPPLNFGDPPFPLDPDALNNPDDLPYVIEWQLDGALMASSTFIYPETNGVDDPLPFIIDPSDINLFGPGSHSVVATLRDTVGVNILQTVNWSFDIAVGGAAILKSVFPATDTGVNAISSVALNGSPTAGFYISDTDPVWQRRRRGTALPTSSFCTEIDDGTGLGGLGSAVQVTFFNDNVYNSISAITPPLLFDSGANPPQVCLDGSGAQNSLDGIPDYTISFTPPDDLGIDDTRFISARVVDKLSNQEIAFVTWNISLQPANTTPIIDYITGSGETENGDTVSQDEILTFSVMVEDKDSRDTPIDATYTGDAGWDEDYSVGFILSFNANNIPLDGSSTFVPADCTRDVSETFVNEQDKFDCVFAIPSFDGNMPAPAGNYEVSAIVADTLTNSIGATLTSGILSWSLTVTEKNSTPTILNWIPEGNPVDPDTQSYVYKSTDIKTAIDTADETDQIVFNLYIDDPEKDDFTLKASYNTSASPTEFHVFEPIPPATPTVQTINGDSFQTFLLDIPDITVTEKKASATIIYRVEVTDIPDAATPITLVFDIPLTINDVNPPPEFSTPTATIDPPFDATATVIEGYPFTFKMEPITDASDVDGAGIEWQWEILSDCATTTQTYQSITGATQPPGINTDPATATLTWSPPAHLNEVQSCIKNCVGDNGFGNPADCSTLEVGPWQGIGDGAVKGIQADTTYSDFFVRQANVPTTDTLMDDASRTLYSVHARDNLIIVGAKVYNTDGTIDDSDNRTFPTVSTATSTVNWNQAENISIAMNSKYIFVSYFISQINSSTGNPVGGIVRLNREVSLTSGELTYSSIAFTLGGIGNVVANESAAYLPFLKKEDNDSITFFYIDGTTAGTPAGNYDDSDLGISASSLYSEIDSTDNSPNKGLVLAAHLKTGLLNVYYYDIPSGLPASDALGSPFSENLDVFGGRLFNFYTMGVGKFKPANNKTYLAAQETNFNLMFTRLNSRTLTSDTGGSIYTFDVGTYPGLIYFKGIEAVASKETDIFYLGVINSEVTDQYNAYILRIVGDGSSFNLTNDKGKRVNVTIDQNFGFINNSSFTLSQVSSNFEMGNAGAVVGENKKDTLWFRYIDNSTTRTTIINVVPETFSGVDPTLDELNNNWTRPWFLK